MIYVIPGKPVSIIKIREAQKRKSWDDQSEAKARIAVDLVNQHGELPLYDGPLKLEVSFYFQFLQPVSRDKVSIMRERGHVINPGLSDLIQFIEWVGKGIIFSHDYLIASIDARKCFDDTARTEFVIKRLE